MKRILLITTGQPSINPRIVKEASALQASGFYVTVLYCSWIQWANNADIDLLENVRWKHQLVGGTPKNNRFFYYFTKARIKLNTALNKICGNRWLIAERAEARCYDELLAAAKSIRADWYIGHNLGALAIAVKAALYNNATSGFDFEDYHREENINASIFERQRIVFLEDKYVPELRYISTSSPFITDKVKENFPFFLSPIITLLNCFALTQHSSPKVKVRNVEELHLFWFSQTVGKNRGLEDVVAALKEIDNPCIHLTLAGRCDNEMSKFLNQNSASLKKCIHLPGIIPPEELPGFAALYDVGLAAEINTPLNRNICLTNKIFTYLLAGNCILASNTDAQTRFMLEHDEVGLLYKNGDVSDLAEKIKFLYNDKTYLQKCKANALNLASNSMNWESESKKLLQVLENGS